jgi:threonine aldolase
VAVLNLAGDAPDIDPADFAARLAKAVAASPPALDEYSRGGGVAVFEERMAAALGKERATLFPTGTLANLLALRAHAVGRGKRIVVQAEGHIANDSGDCASELAGLSLVAIPHAGFTAAAIEAEIARAATARVAAGIAAIVVESPLRRGFGGMVPLSEQDAIVALAREHGVATHLDGARLYIASGFLCRPVRELAAPYDTVYVSLYKYFGVPFGAILAGPAAIIDGLHHDRRRFGGGLNQMWPIAVLADSALDGMEESWRMIAARSKAVVDRLSTYGVAVERAPFGTNVFRISAAEPTGVADRAKALDVKLPQASNGRWPTKANLSWTAIPEDAIVETLVAIFGAGTGP